VFACDLNYDFPYAPDHDQGPMRDSRSGWDDREEEWREKFRRFGHMYAEDHLVSGWSRAGLESRLRVFDRVICDALPGNSHVLDLGCGAGTYVRFLTSRGHRVVGLDYSPPSLGRAHDADPDGLADYIAGDAYNLPFADSSFDAVATIGVLQVLSRPERVFVEICRILRPGGLFILEFLNALEVVSAAARLARKLRHCPARVRFYSPNLMRASLSSCGFEIQRRIGVYLPPRNLPWLGRVLEHKNLMSWVDCVPAISLLAAHSFLLASIKTRVTFPSVSSTLESLEPGR
jgi:ubiquinone/menaquinone biosynthesis C-methylase UbiE